MNQDLSCWGVDAVRVLLKSFDSFLHSDHCVSTSKKAKFGEFIVIAVFARSPVEENVGHTIL